AMVAGSVGVLIGAGVFYIYLDADKRASERALATLQFCHLSLRTADEKRALDEQRSNLSSIHDTAGEIRGLIAKLPPDERAKPHPIQRSLDPLPTRPAPACPACVCEPPRTAAVAEAVTQAKTTTADPPLAAAPASSAHATAASEARHADVAQVPSSSNR